MPQAGPASLLARRKPHASTHHRSSRSLSAFRRRPLLLQLPPLSVPHHGVLLKANLDAFLLWLPVGTGLSLERGSSLADAVEDADASHGFACFVGEGDDVEEQV